MTFQLDYDDICLEQDQHGWVEFYITNSLKQYPRCSRVTPLGRIILLPSQEVFALTQLCCVLSREAKNTSFIVFCMHDRALNTRSTALESSTLTTTGQMQSY